MGLCRVDKLVLLTGSTTTLTTVTAASGSREDHDLEVERFMHHHSFGLQA